MNDDDVGPGQMTSMRPGVPRPSEPTRAFLLSCIISDSNFGANLAYYTYSGAYPFTQIIHRVFSLTLTGTLSYRQEHILSRSPFYSLSYRSDIYS